MSEIRRYKDCGAVFADNCNDPIKNVIYSGTSDVEFVDSPYGTAPYFDGDAVAKFTDKTRINEVLDGEFSLSFRIKPTLDFSYRTIFRAMNNDSASYMRFTTVNKLQTFMTYTDNSTRNIATNTVFNSDEWYTITATYDGANFTVYVNGVFDVTTAVALPLRKGTDGSYFGYLSGIYAYADIVTDDRAWSEQEALDFHNGSTFDYDKHVEANWNMDSVDEIADVGWRKDPELSKTLTAHQFLDLTAFDIDKVMTEGIWDISIDFSYDSSNFNNYGRLVWFIGDVGGPDFFRFQRTIGTNNWVLWVRNSSSSDIAVTSTDLVPNTRMVLRLVGDGSRSKIYVDGVKVADVAITTANFYSPVWSEKRIWSHTTSELTKMYGFKLATDDLKVSLHTIAEGEERYGVTATENGMIDSVTRAFLPNSGTGADFGYKKDNRGSIVGSPVLTKDVCGDALIFADNEYMDASSVVVAGDQTIISCSTVNSTPGIAYNMYGKYVSGLPSEDVIWAFNSTNGFNVRIGASGVAYVAINLNTELGFNIVSLVINRTENEMYAVNNGETSAVSNISTIGTSNGTINRIGDVGGGTYTPLDGNYGKFIVFNSALTTTQIRDVENRIKRGQI